MAILGDVPGVEVSIESKGKTLTEFTDEDGWNIGENIRVPADQQSSKYVQCESDAEFRIRIEVRRPFKLIAGAHGVTFWAAVDGKKIGGRTFHAAHLARDHCSDYICNNMERVSPTEVAERPLKFCSIKKVDIADSERIKEDAKLVAGLGEITIFVHHTKESPKSTPATVSDAGNYQSVKEISEKALKGQALSHGVAFGEEKIVKNNRNMTFSYPQGEKTPLGAFRFKYRSREALQSELIIPRSPSPDRALSPLAPRSENNRNARQSKEARLAHLKKEIDKIKSEDDAPGARKRGDTGSSSGGRPYKTIRKRDGKVVVDLTDD